MRIVFCLIAFIFGISSCKSTGNGEPGPDFPEFVNGTMIHQSKQRKYILHLPDSYDGNAKVPLVVFLHGGGGNAQTAQGFTNFNKVSDDNGFLIVYPQAFFETAADSYAWADGRGLAPDKMGIDDVAFIDSLVTHLKGLYAIDEQSVYLCGFSNGSFLTQRIAFEKNRQFVAFATLGGTMTEIQYNYGDPGRSIPMMFLFGTEDPLVPYGGGYVSGNTALEPVKGIEDAVDFWRQNNRCVTSDVKFNVPNTVTTDNSTVEIYQYADCICNAKVKFYKVIGAGHTWPGVLVPYANSFGATNLDIQASVELWNFFKQFRRCP